MVGKIRHIFKHSFNSLSMISFMVPLKSGIVSSAIFSVDTGINTLFAAVRAFLLSTPKLGGQSIKQ